jgi:hypothetical protein
MIANCQSGDSSGEGGLRHRGIWIRRLGDW